MNNSRDCGTGALFAKQISPDVERVNFGNRGSKKESTREVCWYDVFYGLATQPLQDLCNVAFATTDVPVYHRLFHYLRKPSRKIRATLWLFWSNPLKRLMIGLLTTWMALSVLCHSFQRSFRHYNKITRCSLANALALSPLQCTLESILLDDSFVNNPIIRRFSGLNRLIAEVEERRPQLRSSMRYCATNTNDRDLDERGRVESSRRFNSLNASSCIFESCTVSLLLRATVNL